LPQWNCGCANCCGARLGRIPPLTQSCIGIRDDRGAWFLVNASPDFRSQIHSFPELCPSPGALRGTPIAGVLLTNADLDHVTGLLSLREGGRMQIHATPAVRYTLTNSLGVSAILDAFCGVDWREPPMTSFEPLDGADGSLAYRAIALPGGPPIFAKGKQPQGTHNVAYSFLDRNTGRRLLVAPDVCCVNDVLSDALNESDAVLFDGTFWSGDELSQFKAGARTAAEMGHVTIRDSLPLLAKSKAERKIYIHINNTNPVLSPGSREAAEVTSARIEIGFDGLEFGL
jgi:pyrroloquinoline quinone biosynthesis protein B